MDGNDIIEYDSLADLLGDPRKGFVILHQNKAPGDDYRDRTDDVDSDLTSRFLDYRARLEKELGRSTDTTDQWKEGLPSWASGHGYAIWKRENDFVTVFVSFDNPEDLSFLIAAKAPLGEWSDDRESRDPWSHGWMYKGEW